MADKYYFQSRDSRINQAFIAMDNECKFSIKLNSNIFNI